MMLPIGNKKINNTAFTLLEILVTTTLVASCLVIILGAFHLTLRTSETVKQHLIENTLLSNHLSELEFLAKNEGLDSGGKEVIFNKKFKGSESISFLTNPEKYTELLASVKLNIQGSRVAKSIEAYVISKNKNPVPP